MEYGTRKKREWDHHGFPNFEGVGNQKDRKGLSPSGIKQLTQHLSNTIFGRPRHPGHCSELTRCQRAISDSVFGEHTPFGSPSFHISPKTYPNDDDSATACKKSGFKMSFSKSHLLFLLLPARRINDDKSVDMFFVAFSTIVKP